MGNDSVLHAGISCSLTHKPYFAKLSKDPSHLGDDGDDDGESLAGGDVSGLSELGSSISSAATASSLSRSDSLLSRLACQLQDIQLFKTTMPEKAKPQPSTPCSQSSAVSSPSMLSQYLKAPRKMTTPTAMGKDEGDEGASPPFQGNGKNDARVLPSFVPQLQCCSTCVQVCALNCMGLRGCGCQSLSLAKVVQTLYEQAHNLPSLDPIPISAQYVANLQAQDHDDEEGACDTEAKPEVRKTTFRRKVSKKGPKGKPKKKSVKKNAKPACGKPVEVAQQAGKNPGYNPQDFNQRYKAFLAAAKKDGASHKAALEMWHSSQEKAQMLAGLTLGQLKRRRFVPTACTQHPFLAASLGGA